MLEFVIYGHGGNLLGGLHIVHLQGLELTHVLVGHLRQLLPTNPQKLPSRVMTTIILLSTKNLLKLT